MKNIKLLITSGLILISVMFVNASNLFTALRNVEVNDAKVIPVNKPSHLEKNTNAKFIAKQLTKLASSNSLASAILGKSSSVLGRYGYHTSTNATFFSNSEGALAGSPTESNAILSVNRSERGDVVRVKVESNKDLQVYLNTKSGMGVPFELMNLGENEVFISPLYTLPNGDYIIRLKVKASEKKLKLKIEQREFLGNK